MAFDWARKWILGVFLKKAIKRGILMVVAWVSAQKIAEFGVTVDQTALTAGVWTGLEAVRQWLKVKTDWSWL